MAQSNILPWNHEEYKRILATNGNVTWTERETQIYISFMQLLIGKSLTNEEINEIRESNIADFSQKPQAIKTDVSQTESIMSQVYASNSPDHIAYLREELVAFLFQSAHQNTDLNDSPFMKVYNRHVQILQFDPSSRLSLSNQDVEAYLKYLQFQSMLMGQSYKMTPEEKKVMQLQLVNNFNLLPLQQKQSLAYASFIWDSVEKQWSGLNPEQKREYLRQVQSQMNAQNSSVAPEEIEESMQTSEESTEDIQALVDKSKKEAAEKGMSAEEYLNFKKRELNANSAMFTMMQNSMTENHVTMMNVINNLGGGNDDYYYVDYSGQ